jgi:hypothetical protein
MRVIYKDDASYIVAVDTLFDSDLAEFEECQKDKEVRRDGN